MSGSISGGRPERVWTAVDDYLEGLFPEDEVLLAAQAAADAAGMPAIQVSPMQGRLLQVLTQAVGARRALEVGTLAGVSTIWIARGLTGPDAHVTTLEVEARHAEVARANLARAGLADVVDVRVGPGVDSLAALVDEGVQPFDLVFIDADKPSNTAYLQAGLRLSHPGTVIVVDNVVRQGAVADADSADPRILGSRAVIEAVAADPRLTASVVQTVGSKGYDGFLLIRRQA